MIILVRTKEQTLIKHFFKKDQDDREEKSQLRIFNENLSHYNLT